MQRRAPAEARPIAGLVVRRGRNLEVEPLFQEGTPLLIGRDGVKPRAGDLVLFVYAYGRRVRILRVIGRKTVLADVLEALLLDTLGGRGFEAEVLAEAAEAAASHERRDTFRSDLRDLFTFTVDPETARDFDDALSFAAGPDGLVTVYVHIADVSYYVEEGTGLDEEALRRGTSVYVPTGVEPMLPALLSSGVCSLQPGEDRKAVTVEADVASDGQVKRVVFYRSLLRSDRRLTYEELEERFCGGGSADPELTEALTLGRPLAQRLREERFARGSLRITSTEPEFHYDEKGVIVDAHRAEELESHGFIEEYMLLANERVALYLERERVPAVFRVHEQPDPFRVDHLLDVLSSLDLPTPVFDPMLATQAELRRVMRETADWVGRCTPKGRGKDALVSQVLRAQARAVYQTKNIGHFGLALGTYTHFTSPIRRYPDLLVHRALLSRLGLGPEPTTSTLEEWTEHCSRTEREAAKVELRADDIALAHLLQTRLETHGADIAFDGQILGLVHAGAFVLFAELFQGFLSVRRLPADYYELDELGTALVGRRSGTMYRLADEVRIQVTGIDVARGRVDVALAGVDDQD